MGFGHQYGALLRAIADEADAMSMRAFRADDLQVQRKRDGTALTQADGAIEAMARAKVAASGITLDVYGEEMGTGASNSSSGPATSSGRPRLIIDPIDGTEEFSRGIPTFGTLLGIEKNGEIVAGMASAPALQCRWWAFRGEGAYRNGHRIYVSDTPRLNDAMIFTTGTGPTKNAEDRARIRRLSDAARNSRALGGFWQHMLVAEGAFDISIDPIVSLWDVAALLPIIEEAGGRCTTLSGERDPDGGSLVCTNGRLHDEALTALHPTAR
jgi:histidinol-phosphatase